jgi:hypothetical protein
MLRAIGPDDSVLTLPPKTTWSRAPSSSAASIVCFG